MASSPAAAVLNSWKEIANYLGRGVRTVQRYEHQSHLPVRRLSHGQRGAVIAFREDLDNWLRQTATHHVTAANSGAFHPFQTLQTHQQVISKLSKSLETLQQQIAEGRQIRRRKQWFAQDSSQQS